MNVAALSTLAAILDKGSFAAAAHAVGCTPSAVSLQVKQLEAYFGQTLFDRSARIARPTPFAHAVGAVARELVVRIESLRTRPSTGVAGRVRLGAIASIQADALAPALRRLRDRHPALAVELALGDSAALLVDLKAGRIDAAALIRPRSGGSSRLAWQDLARQPFVMLAPAGAATGTPKELLERFGWVRYDASLTGGRIAAECVRRAYPRARATIELRSIDAIVAMVGAGLGVSVVPRPAQPLLDAHGVLVGRLGAPCPTRQVSMARRGADTGNRNLDALFDALASVYDARLGPRAPLRRSRERASPQVGRP
jgi:DNA-binding transcriptional LysR family regulator